MKLTLSRKVLIIVAIPVAFQLAFVTVLTQLLRNANEQARQEADAKEAIAYAQAINKTTYDIAVTLLTYSVTHNELYARRYNSLSEQVLLALAGLRSKVIDKPEQLERVARLGQLWDRTAVLLANARTNIERGGFDLSTVTGKQFQAEIKNAMTAIISVETELCEEELKKQLVGPAEQARLQQLVNYCLGAAVPLNILIAAALTMLFNRPQARIMNVPSTAPVARVIRLSAAFALVASLSGCSYSTVPAGYYTARYWDLSQSAGGRAFLSGNLSGAQHNYEKALLQARKLGMLNTRYAATVRALASVQMAAGNPQAAIPLFAEAAGIYTKLWQARPDSGFYLGASAANSWLNGARCYAALGQYKQAQQCLLDAMDIDGRLPPQLNNGTSGLEIAQLFCQLERKSQGDSTNGKASRLWFTTLMNRADDAARHGRLVTATNIIASLIGEASFTDQPTAELCKRLDAIAQSSIMSGHPREAIHAYQLALARIGGNRTITSASGRQAAVRIAMGLSKACQSSGDQPTLIRALSETVRALGPDYQTRDTLSLKLDIAGTCANSGDTVTARKFYEEALINCQKMKSDQSFPTYAILDSITKLYDREGDKDKSLLYRCRTAQAAEREIHPVTQELIDKIMTAAETLRQSAQYDQATPYYVKAIKLQEGLGADRQERILNAQYLLAENYRAVNKVDPAIELYRRVIAARKKQWDSGDERLLWLEMVCAEACRAGGRYAEAESAYLGLVKDLPPSRRTAQIDLAGVLLSLGDTYRMRQMHAQAESAYKRSLSLTTTRHGAHAAQLCPVLLRLGQLDLDQKHVRDAIAVYERLQKLEKKLNLPTNDSAGMLDLAKKMAQELHQ